jgi:hypothetical protein
MAVVGHDKRLCELQSEGSEEGSREEWEREWRASEGALEEAGHGTRIGACISHGGKSSRMAAMRSPIGAFR